MYQYVRVGRREVAAAAASPPPGLGPAGAPPPPKPEDVWEDQGPAVSFPDGPAFTTRGEVVVDPKTSIPFGQPTIHDGPVWTWSWEEGAGHGCLHSKLTFWACWIRRRADGHYEIVVHQTPKPKLGGTNDASSPQLDDQVTVGIYYQQIGSPSPVEFGSLEEDGAVFIGQRRYGLGAPIRVGTDAWQVVRAAGPRRVIKHYQHGRLVNQLYFADRWLRRGWYTLYANYELGGPPLWVRLLWVITSRWVRFPCLILFLLAVLSVPITPCIVYPAAISWLALLITPPRPDDPFWAVDAEVP